MRNLVCIHIEKVVPKRELKEDRKMMPWDKVTDIMRGMGRVIETCMFKLYLNMCVHSK